MSFFNSKEEVLDILLTEYGKKLYSEGKFKPVYYSFYDEEVIYDTQYAGFAEAQNDSESRIISGTIYPKLQNLYASSNENYRLDILNSATKASLGSPIGTSDPSVVYYPAWDISILNGKLSSSVLNTASYRGYDSERDYIPQINLYSEDVKIRHTNESFGAINLGKDEQILTREFNNGFLVIQDAYNLFEIVENNVVEGRDNFEIEVFAVEDNNLVPLSFIRKAKEVKNNILLDKPEDGLTNDEMMVMDSLNIDETFVEDHFNILFDSEIPEEQLDIGRLQIYDPTITISPDKDNC
jgi:hypothetical protein